MAAIDHIAIWTHDLERLKEFYAIYFGARTGSKYTNPAKNFQSYFLSFASGARLELMQRPEITAKRDDPRAQFSGYIHLAISTGSELEVDRLTARLQKDGYPLVDGPRWTGDGYYESIILDPDGNRIEITI